MLLQISIAPVAFLLLFIYKKDVISKEPRHLLVKAFLLGVLCVLLDLAILLPFQAFFGEASSWDGMFWSTFGESFIEAGIPEELCKFLMLYLFVWKRKEFDEHFDGIVYATFISMGFACLENIMYVLTGGVGTGVLRAITAVPGHFFFAVIMGYFFSLAKFDKPNRTSHMIKAITIPMIVHGIYDFICFSTAKVVDTDDESNIATILLLLVAFFAFNFTLWRHGLKRIKELQGKDIAVQQGLALPPINDSVPQDPTLDSSYNNNINSNL